MPLVEHFSTKSKAVEIDLYRFYLFHNLSSGGQAFCADVGMVGEKLFEIGVPRADYEKLSGNRVG